MTLSAFIIIIDELRVISRGPNNWIPDHTFKKESYLSIILSYICLLIKKYKTMFIMSFTIEKIYEKVKLFCRSHLLIKCSFDFVVFLNQQ